MPRLFVAVRPPADVLARLEELPRPDETGVRWVPPSQWHITLRFLGEAAVEVTEAALRTLRDEIARGGGHPPARGGAASVGFTAELGPSVSRLGRSVVCVPARGLDELAAAVAAVTAGIGEPPDPRPFAGHLTLARLGRRGSCGLAGAPVSARFDVTEVELVRSTLRSSGAEHEVVAVVPIVGPDPARPGSAR